MGLRMFRACGDWGLLLGTLVLGMTGGWSGWMAKALRLFGGDVMGRGDLDGY